MKTEKPILTGVVKFYNEVKGYGFIKCPELTTDAFFTLAESDNPLSKGNDVEFQLTKGRNGGNRAINIKRL
jgi:cold shock CspA family protein